MISNKQFQLKKDGSLRRNSYCAHPELIENYDLAIADKERTWYCHHKKEEFYTHSELLDLGIYYNVPPEDLVFVRDQEEHYSWPHKGKSGEETKRKMSESYSRKVKVKCVETGQIFETIKAAAKFAGLKGNNPIRVAIKNPKRTAGGYHWSKL